MMRSRLTVFVSRLRDLWLRRRLDRDLEAEIDLHLELLTDEYVRRGLSPVRARAEARARFGRISHVRDGHWEQRGFQRLDSWMQDGRFGARMLVRNLGFSAVVVLTLGVAVGVNTTVFTIVDAIRLRGLPVDEPHRIVAIRYPRDDAGRDSGISYRDFQDWRRAEDVFAAVAAFRRTAFTVRDADRAPEQVQGLYISADGFRLLGETPLLGRDFLPEDDAEGAPPVVVLGWEVWNRRYLADSAVIGRRIHVNDTPTVVIGVMRKGFAFDFYADVWQPLALMPGLDRQRREARTLQAFAKLRRAVDVEQAQSALRSFDDEEDDTGAGAGAGQMHLGATVSPFTGTLTDDPMLLALMLSAGFVFLVACANVAGLLSARSAHRSREIWFRVSMGATRWRIVRQLLVEGSLLAVLAGAAGFLLSLLGVDLFTRSIEGIVRPYWIHLNMDGRGLAFLIAISAGSVVVFALAPALRLARTNATETERNAGERLHPRRVGGGLTVVQLAVTLVLLASAGLMMRSFLALYQSDRAVDTSQLLVSSLSLSEASYPTAFQRIAFFQRLEERLEASGDFTSATLSSTIPFAGGSARDLTIEGRPTPNDSSRSVTYVAIGSRYFQTLGLRLVRGATFAETDGLPGHESAIVNELFVDRLFPDETPLGKRIRLEDPAAAEPPGPWLTIVGVSPTVRQRRFQAESTVYVPYRAVPEPSTRLIVRGASPDMEAVVSALREEVRAMDPNLPLYAVMAGDELLSQSRWSYRVIGTMLVAFALIALLVAVIGLYAVTAYSVARRTHEIGVRRALGAANRQVSWLIGRQVSLQLAFGTALGLAGALGAGRFLRSFLVDTSATDPATLVIVALVLIVAGGLAGLVPARRAIGLDPVTALRHE